MLDNHIDAIPFSVPGVAGVRCLFSTRRAGDMALRDDPVQRAAAVDNRERFMAAAGFGAWADLHQVHGDTLVPAKGRRRVDAGETDEADGLYSFEKRVGLIIQTGDCQPILLARDDGGAVAALHVGWRGNAMNFPGTAVERLCALFSCRPERLVAVRGPSLGPAAAEFVNFAREWPKEFEPWYNPAGKTVDLWALTRSQLERAGMRPERIFSLDMCTRDMAECFFSYRRKEMGRQVAAIWRE